MMSPPAWGWPAAIVKLLVTHADVPTRVGMARLPSVTLTPADGCPHPRGDGPPDKPRAGRRRRMSPPAWGWPGGRRVFQVSGGDVPTRVGMARNPQRLRFRQLRCPHPRGDGPRLSFIFQPCQLMSPPAWGWPVPDSCGGKGVFDVPTRVGMARACSRLQHSRLGCPHPRGDGPPKTSTRRTP